MRYCRLPRAVSGSRRGGGGHGMVLTAHPFLHAPCPAPTCILLLLERIDLTGEAPVDVTGHVLGCLIS